MHPEQNCTIQELTVRAVHENAANRKQMVGIVCKVPLSFREQVINNATVHQAVRKLSSSRRL